MDVSDEEDTPPLMLVDDEEGEEKEEDIYPRGSRENKLESALQLFNHAIASLPVSRTVSHTEMLCNWSGDVAPDKKVSGHRRKLRSLPCICSRV
jgi:hypothetical protein